MPKPGSSPVLVHHASDEEDFEVVNALANVGKSHRRQVSLPRGRQRNFYYHFEALGKVCA